MMSIPRGIQPVWIGAGFALLVGASSCASSIPIVQVKQSDFQTALLFEDDFRDGEIDRLWMAETAEDYSAQVVDAPDGSSGKAVRFELRQDDSDVEGSRRAELVLPIDEAEAERWYGFRHFVPEDWQNDLSAELITQWHAYPDLDKGEEWRSPPLYIRIEGEKMEIRLRWDSREITPNNQPEGTATLWSGSFERGDWIDWVFHVKWSAFDDGTLRVWRNGEIIVNHSGPNTYNDERGVFFKTGIYKPDWKYRPEESTTTRRVLYAADFRIAGKHGNFAD